MICCFSWGFSLLLLPLADAHIHKRERERERERYENIEKQKLRWENVEKYCWNLNQMCGSGFIDFKMGGTVVVGILSINM